VNNYNKYGKIFMFFLSRFPKKSQFHAVVLEPDRGLFSVDQDALGLELLSRIPPRFFFLLQPELISFFLAIPLA